MNSNEPPAELNSSQKRHLFHSAEYADKLLADIEAVLYASKSKSPFPKYKAPLSLAQTKVVADYLARIRTQMLHVVESQGIPSPEPKFESIRSIRVALAFVRIAFQECTADRMRGYGEVPPSKIRELNGLVEEMVSAADKLDAYLAQGLGQDLEGRLKRLEQAGGDVDLVTILERIVNTHGLVEFRSTLSMIVDRLETKTFEIALFGRVSSGKSSLLNYMVQTDILPVGVNPITAVPTRLMYGAEPRLLVNYADRKPEVLDVARLPEFVSERHNPANEKHVTRIVAELPSPRLRDGVVLVDTPGLGSLASSGAAETLAYLPRCDLGVVLIDAGSTLTENDLATVRTLYDAGIPASVLLSKADLLHPDDQRRSLDYVARQIHSQLGLSLSVHPVSVQPSHASLLESWVSGSIVPLYGRRQELMLDSLRRKIGALRESVETALKVRLNGSGVAAPRTEELSEMGVALRDAGGRIAEVRERCWKLTVAFHDGAGQHALAAAATELVESWDGGTSFSLLDSLGRSAARDAAEVFKTLNDLARELAVLLRRTGAALGFADIQDDPISDIKEMPRLDPGSLMAPPKPPWVLGISKGWAIRSTKRALRKQIGPQVEEAFAGFSRILDSWARFTLNEIQRQFETRADGYRAHLERMAGAKQVPPAQRQTLARDLSSIQSHGTRSAH
jgi:GTP-binding protein EngB required for normal cell division